mgnify:CR=1 FL=1
MSQDAEAAFEMIQSRGWTEPVDVAFVLGTGLGDMTEGIENQLIVPYDDLPGFPKLTISGHEGRLVIGKLEDTTVVFLQGRSHYYEHGDPRAMAVALETIADRKSTRLNSSYIPLSRMPSSA